MSDKKVKISNILGSQIPDFIQADNPLFKEFLSQYYESEEREYGTTYLAEHISSFKKISTVADVSLVEKQTIPVPNTKLPSSPVVLSSVVFAYDNVIDVNQTVGFPEKYGLLKIDDEIITYTGKTSNSFTGCVRGFSGISEIESKDNPEFLTFSDTNASGHDGGSTVINLSFLFVTEFYKKFKKHFLPGLEGRNLSYGLNIENILSRARDFYNSKGTDTSLKILFQVLYGVEVDIIKPFEQTIMPSEAEWDVTDDIIVEAIEGNPLNLIGDKIFQDSFINPTASGSVANVQTKSLKSKKYYQISFSKGTIIDKFNVSTKTQVVGAASTTEVLTVDSTIGFGETGNFYYKNEDEIYTIAEYKSKSYNQFFGCTNVSRVLNESDPIIDSNFIYGYEHGDLTKVCTMRITGSISKDSNNSSNTKFYDVNDEVGVKYLGEKTKLDDKKFNSWFYNNISYVDIISHPPDSFAFTTQVDHFLKEGDLVDIIYKSSNNTIIKDATVDSIVNPKRFVLRIDAEPADGTIIGGDYIVKKKINYAPSSFGIKSILSNIQNTFIDEEKNTYIAFSGYPSFETETTNRSKVFNSVGVSTNLSTINIPNHNFLNGERVYIDFADNSGLVGCSSGYFYVNFVDENNIKLSLSLSGIDKNIFKNIKFIGGSDQETISHTITPSTLYDGKKLGNQNNFKRIYKNPKTPENNLNIIGPVGVSLNGVEYHSPLSSDSITYGQIDEVQVLNPGKNFNVANPPTIQIIDDNGSNSEVVGNFSGSVSEIILNTPGFDYSTTPSVKIIGGNGNGAVCEAKMKGFSYKKTFTDFDVNLSNNTFVGEHRFLDGEEVTYITTGRPIGININTSEANVGFRTDLLSSDSSYFVAKIDNNSFRLAVTKEKAINKTNLIEFTAFGNRTHTFSSKKIRKVIDRIIVLESGSNYKNKRVLVSSEIYPPSDKKNLFKTFVGINTFNNYIYAKNHNFNNGDVLEYSCSGTVISGLSASTVYKVTVIDNDKFKLSNAGTATTVSNLNYDRKIFENLNSIGSGTHTFKYPDIEVKISSNVSTGLTSIIPDYYKASAKVIVNGGIDSIFVKNGGVGYGVTNIINYPKNPIVKPLLGKDGAVTPIIVDGIISNVTVLNGGSEYTTPPTLEVIGIGGTQGTSGSFAKLEAVVSGGKIQSVNIINSGTGYDSNNTKINIIPSGSNFVIVPKIHEWIIDSVKRFNHVLTENNSEMIQIKSTYTPDNKICSFYPVKKYRKLIDDLSDSGETVDSHSKIVGWAYDGNPIYGPVGQNNVGLTTFLRSGYTIDKINDTNLRPPNYVGGYFVDDYVFSDGGDLDEHNGKFLVNQDFPNGTYAYFSTIDNLTLNPSFPYITFLHRDATDKFNYDITQKQSNFVLNSGEYKRNVTHLGLNEDFRKYPILSDPLESQPLLKIDGVKSSNINNISINESGLNYKVNDRLIFNDPTITASVDEVLGKSIISVGTTNTFVSNLKFSVIDGKVTGLSTIPHELSDGDIVEISGISSTLYENIGGVRTIGVSTVTSAISAPIQNIATTGITTFLNFFDPTISRKFEINDIVQINTEQFLIIDHDDVNNRYRVKRQHNFTNPTTHDAGSIVKRLETKFTYQYPKKIENKNIDLPKVQFFEATKSVGIGSTVTNVIVGRVGTNSGIGTIFKSIPPKAIYLPNHKFLTGEEVSLVSSGSTIKASKEADLSSQFDLAGISTIFCVKLSTDFIGLTTEKVGVSTNNIETVFFADVLVNDVEVEDSNKIETVTNNISGELTRVNGTVTVATATTTGQQHGLSVGDKFNLNITSNKVQNFDLKYNENIRKLVVNPTIFPSSSVGIGTSLSKITINEHDFVTGDLIVYNSTTPATPLIDNGVYYVVNDSKTTIRLVENLYDISVFPYNYITITDNGSISGTHQISKINPKLKFYKNNTVKFSTLDPSLDDFDIEFFNDFDFKSKYNSDLITKTKDEITIRVEDSLENEFYYKVKGKETNDIKTLSFAVDERVTNRGQIKIIDSEFNKEFSVIGIGTSVFKFNPTGIAETTSYDTTGFSSAFYSTNSLTETGGIHSIKLLNKGFSVAKLPILTSIASTGGVDSVLTIETNDIGSIDGTEVINQGLEFSPDKTLKPKANNSTILELKNTLTLKTIGIATGGVNYTFPPKITAIGKPSIVARTKVKGTSVSDVQILTNDSGLSSDLRVVPTTNSNGIVVTDASIDSNKTVELKLRAPAPEVSNQSGFFNNGGSFPFQIGDKIFVENIKIIDDVDGNPTGTGYNSSDYDYKFFTVSNIEITGGQEAVYYSLAGLGITAGIYQSNNNFGRVIKKEDLAVFTPIFEDISFFDRERVEVIGKNISGVVAKNGWDVESQTLKVIDLTGDFQSNDQIIGKISNTKSTIAKQFKFDFDLDVDSTANITNNWKTNIGELNSDIQNLHDNDYYQRFSYSIKGNIPFLTWKNTVDSLDHVAGFKNFCNLGIGSTAQHTLSSDADLALEVDIDQEASVHEKFYYDMGTEDTDDPNLSKLISFNSKIITNYNESRTNKVLIVDDISSQFTGIITTTGGSVVGLTSFKVFTDGDRLFHKEFKISGISTTTDQINIPRHNFNTGERLIYKPEEGQNSIGIADTSAIGVGVTNLLPSSLFAIRIDKDNIKVAIAASFASVQAGVAFTGLTGIGNTHILTVPSDDATIRTLISIDNVIQSPLGITTAISVGLGTTVGVGSTSIFLNDISEIAGKSLLKIEDEIIKVNLVGVGSTNSLSVVRGEMGTVAAAHTVGAAVTVIKGDYRINEGKIYFSEAPYGPRGIPDPESKTNTAGITTFSTFSGRSYYRLDYANNKIIDDISDRFDGSTSQFNLTTNNVKLVGINTSFGAILINNIFQRPFYGDVGSINRSDYQIVGTGETISFTGTSGNKDLPRGGIINEFDVGIGTGYQVPRKALFSAVVSNSGTISTVGILTGGSGYITPPIISIASSTGSGATIEASITAGVVTSLNLSNSGSGYSNTGISTGLNFVTAPLPSPYTNIPLSGGSGSGAKIDVVVGTGGSIISFDMTDRGIGYEIGDVLELTTLFHQVGIATTSFKITVKNKFQDKFAGWTFGQLLELDDFSQQFNGFRKSFLIKRDTEYYSIVAAEGSDIILQNNLLIFLNDVLQKPGRDYVFNGGTRINFKEAPRKGSKFKIYFYTGSSEDYLGVEVEETIKPGDELRLQYYERVSEQENRPVYELISSDTVETTTYGGIGISTDGDFDRPIMWRKQTEDTVIDGRKISKKRSYLEPGIAPSSGIIKSISPTDTKIYIKDSWLFQQVDNLGQTENNISIVGLGSTSVETIEKVTYSGDYGNIVGIGLSPVGINTTGPAIFFEIEPDSKITGSGLNKVEKSGISTGDYFVVKNTYIGSNSSGVTGIKTTSSGPEIVGVGNSFLDGVYFVEHFDQVGTGETVVRVFSNVQSISGIDTSTVSSNFKGGNYSWGAVNVTRNSNSKSFTFHNLNGLVGIETSPQVIRSSGLRLIYST